MSLWKRAATASEEDESENEWKIVWKARLAVLEKILGRSSSRVHFSSSPMFLGGNATVLEFPEYLKGTTYVTADLTGWDMGQIPTDLGNYELMIVTRKAETFAPNLISRLARHSVDVPLRVGETMDCPIFEGSKIEALLFTLPPTQSSFEVFDAKCGVLLVVGITGEELRFAFHRGGEALLARLKAASVFPHTDLNRESVPGIS